MKNKYLFTIILLPLFCSCEMHMIKYSLNNTKAEMFYVFDSVPIKNKKPFTVRLNAVTVKKDLPKEIVIEHVDKGSKSSDVAYQYWNKYKCRLGKKSLKQEPKEFIYDSLIEEMKRSGKFTLVTDKQSNAEYTIRVELVECDSVTYYEVYKETSCVSTTTREMVKPAEAKIALNISLYHADRFVKDTECQSTKTVKFITSRVRNVYELRRNCVANMAEALSLCAKECVGKTVAFVNQTITEIKAK